MRYQTVGSQEDLDQAIQCGQKAVSLTLEGDPDRAIRLITLSVGLSMRFELSRDQEDLDQAIECARKGYEYLNNPLSLRLRGCMTAVDLLTKSQRWHEAQKLLKKGLKILPFLILQTSHLSSKLDQEDAIKSISGLAAIGCAISLQFDSDGYNALKVLESGRGTINRLMINSRKDISPLYKCYPYLARRFEHLRNLVNAPSKPRGSAGNTIPERSTLFSELKKLTSEIRTKEGLEHFQMLPSMYQLLGTATRKIGVFFEYCSFP